MIRVLVVDHSPSVRELLAQILDADPRLQVVGRAPGGEQALAMCARLRPHVVTIDLQMSGMDCLEAIRRIMREYPTPIVVLGGSDSPDEVDAGFRAIEAGALVLVRRPPEPAHPDHATAAQALVRTVKSMAEVRVVRRWPARRGAHGASRPASPKPHRLVLLGASTGGPAVLRDILAELGQDFALSVVIVQHLPPGFSAGLAGWLAHASGFPVALAGHDQPLSPGCAWLAPDGYQLGVSRTLCAELSLAPPEHGMRPAVAHLFRSVPPELREQTVAALLTGMGKDGAQELKQLRDDGAITIVQDRASAAVYGMPGEAVRLDAARLVLEPTQIGRVLRAIANHPGGDLSLLGPREE
ncbi:chemotaxis protein CheB [Massilia horti]|uniref:protein-glutamate methylesterase n=1 Tax=Massilia horti TaxID=2562153 RepID=A0A4Y9T482_9BURK|nr:chemotaxis protein CheB [Massilia horti]TFW35347.1 response regulator [Massilia horti]